MHPVETEHDREEEGHGCVDEEGVEGAGSGLCVREGGELDGQPVGAKKKKKKRRKGQILRRRRTLPSPLSGSHKLSTFNNKKISATKKNLRTQATAQPACNQFAIANLNPTPCVSRRLVSSLRAVTKSRQNPICKT